MKKTTIGIILALLIVSMATSALAGTNATLVSTGSSIDATLLTYQPVPAQPGDLLNVWIQVTNEGGSPSKAGTVRILQSFPFATEGAGEDVKSFPSIPGRSSFLVKTTVRVDKNANEGDNVLKISFNEAGSTPSERDLHLTVQGKTGAISIVSATSEPARIAPGGKGTLTLLVKNVGGTTLRNLDVGLTLTGMSLAPTTSGTSKTISTLGGMETAAFTFEVISYPDAVPKAYQLPVTVAYQDEQGNSIAQDETIGLVIGATPELLIYPERIEISEQTLEGPVVIKFVNRGLTQVKLLEMTIQESAEVEVISESPTVYVGNIDTDDYESAEVQLRLTKQEASVPIKVTYRDALNEPYEETITVKVASKASGNGGGVSWQSVLLVIVVLALIATWVFRRRGQAKKK